MIPPLDCYAPTHESIPPPARALLMSISALEHLRWAASAEQSNSRSISLTSYCCSLLWCPSHSSDQHFLLSHPFPTCRFIPCLLPTRRRSCEIARPSSPSWDFLRTLRWNTSLNNNMASLTATSLWRIKRTRSTPKSTDRPPRRTHPRAHRRSICRQMLPPPDTLP